MAQLSETWDETFANCDEQWSVSMSTDDRPYVELECFQPQAKRCRLTQRVGPRRKGKSSTTSSREKLVCETRLADPRIRKQHPDHTLPFTVRSGRIAPETRKVRDESQHLLTLLGIRHAGSTNVRLCAHCAVLEQFRTRPRVRSWHQPTEGDDSMNFLRRYWFLAVLLLIIGSVLQAQPGDVLGIDLQTIGVVCIFASALWVLAVLIEWAYRNAIGSK